MASDTVFMATVGVRYAQEVHPAIPVAHPDGWLEFVGMDRETARVLAHALTEGRFAFLYGESEFDSSYHPSGPFGYVTFTQRAVKQCSHHWVPVPDGKVHGTDEATYVQQCRLCGQGESDRHERA